MPTEFLMFESGPGGDFSTYIGQRTGSIYRLDLGKIYYLKLKLETLILPAIEGEGNLIKIPEEIKCKICGTTYKAEQIMVGGEEHIEAFEL
jgi:hypothetical protein